MSAQSPTKLHVCGGTPPESSRTQSLTLLQRLFCLFSHEKKASFIFGTSSPSLFLSPFSVWIHLLCCHLLRKSLRWEMRQSHSAVLLLLNLFFSLIQAHSNFFTLHTPTHQSACLLQLGLLTQSHAHL